MRRFSKYSLFLAAPLALASSGCVTGTSWVFGRGHQDPAVYQQHLAQAAQRYEEDGQYESAYRMYNQLALQQPNNQIAQQKLQQLAQKMNSTESADSSGQATPRTADQALKMLAQIQAQHREEVTAKRHLHSRNPDAMLAEIQQRLEAYKAEQGKIHEALDSAPAAAPGTPAGSVASAAPRISKSADAAPPALDSKPGPAPRAVVAANRAARAESTTVVNWNATESAGKVTQADKPEPPAPGSTELPTVVSRDAKTEALPQVMPARSKDWQTTSLARLCEHVPAELNDAMAMLDSTEVDRKIDGLSLLTLKGEQAKPVSMAVRALLKHENPVVRAHAAEALFAIEHDTWDSVNTLAGILGNQDEAVVQLSCYLLGQMGPAAQEAVPHLQITLANTTGMTSLHAAEALVRITGDHEEAFDALEDALASDDRDLRWFGAVAMGSVTGPLSTQAAEALKDSLHDTEADVRAAAALSLGGMGQNAEAAINELEQVAMFDEQDVRDAASTALACLKR